MERVVDGHLYAVVLGSLDEVVEILETAKARIEGQVAALFRADGPGAPGVTRASKQRVVLPLAETVADGVDRWDVQDIEAQVGQAGDLRGRTPQAAKAAREQLVPGADGSPLAVYPYRGRRGGAQVPG